MRDRGPLAEKAGDVADSLAEGLAEKVAGDVRRKGKEKAAVEDEEGAAVEELLGDVKVAGEADEEERTLPRSPDLTPEELKDQFIDRLKTVRYSAYRSEGRANLRFPTDSHPHPEEPQLSSFCSHDLCSSSSLHSLDNRLTVSGRHRPSS